jgi:hypothetical protein
MLFSGDPADGRRINAWHRPTMQDDDPSSPQDRAARYSAEIGEYLKRNFGRTATREDLKHAKDIERLLGLRNVSVLGAVILCRANKSTDCALAVYLIVCALSDNDKNGACSAAYRTLGEALDRHEDSVREAVNRLVDLGLLKKELQPGLGVLLWPAMSIDVLRKLAPAELLRIITPDAEKLRRGRPPKTPGPSHPGFLDKCPGTEHPGCEKTPGVETENPGCRAPDESSRESSHQPPPLSGNSRFDRQQFKPTTEQVDEYHYLYNNWGVKPDAIRYGEKYSREFAERNLTTYLSNQRYSGEVIGLSVAEALSKARAKLPTSHEKPGAFQNYFSSVFGAAAIKYADLEKAAARLRQGAEDTGPSSSSRSRKVPAGPVNSMDIVLASIRDLRSGDEQ